MPTNKASTIDLNTGTDLAFALVVFVSFFTTFSTNLISSFFLITIIIFLGIAYITNGIYGFSYAKKSKSNLTKIGYFLIQFVLGGLIMYYGKGAGLNALILLPVVAHSAMMFDQDWSLLTNFGLIITYAIAAWSYSQSLMTVLQGFPTFFVGQVFILIFTQMALTEKSEREKLELLANELSDANKHLSQYAEQVRQLSVTEERNRLAREIHDGLGHHLTTINMQLSAAEVIVQKDAEKAKRMLRDAQKLTTEALLDVRNSVYALRSDEYSTYNITDRIERLVKDSSSDVRIIEFDVIGSPREITPQVDLTIFRTAQETINNAQKYSSASLVKLTLDFSLENVISFSTVDNGIGTDKIEDGFGLLGIKERVRLLNGDFLVNSSSGEGFTIQITLPG